MNFAVSVLTAFWLSKCSWFILSFLSCWDSWPDGGNIASASSFDAPKACVPSWKLKRSRLTCLDLNNDCTAAAELTICVRLPPNRMVQTWTFVPVANSLDRSIRQKEPGFSFRKVSALPSQGIKYGRMGGGIALDEFVGWSSRALNFAMVRLKLTVVMTQVRRHVVSRMSGVPKRIM